jgi:hypothetical protein
MDERLQVFVFLVRLASVRPTIALKPGMIFISSGARSCLSISLLIRV